MTSQTSIRRHAKEFLEATVQKWGTDTDEVRDILEWANRKGVKAAFAQEVLDQIDLNEAANYFDDNFTLNRSNIIPSILKQEYSSYFSRSTLHEMGGLWTAKSAKHSVAEENSPEVSRIFFEKQLPEILRKKSDCLAGMATVYKFRIRDSLTGDWQEWTVDLKTPGGQIYPSASGESADITISMDTDTFERILQTHKVTAMDIALYIDIDGDKTAAKRLAVLFS